MRTHLKGPLANGLYHFRWGSSLSGVVKVNLLQTRI